MSKYIKKEELSPELEENSKDRKIRNQATTIECMTRILKSVGITPFFTSGSSTIPAYRHAGLKACRCGYMPQIVEDPQAEGWFAVICTRCVLSTESYRRVIDAIRAWKDERYTDDTEMLLRPLTADGMSTEGAEQLFGALRAGLCEDYLLALKMGDKKKAAEIEKSVPNRAASWKRLLRGKQGDF